MQAKMKLARLFILLWLTLMSMCRFSQTKDLVWQDKLYSQSDTNHKYLFVNPADLKMLLKSCILIGSKIECKSLLQLHAAS